jgi:hypothetical protein
MTFDVLGIKDVIWHDRLEFRYGFYEAGAFGLTVGISNAIATMRSMPEYKYTLAFDSETMVPDRTFLNGWADAVARFLIGKGYEIIRADWYMNNDTYKYYMYKNTYDAFPDDVEKWVTVEPIEPPPETKVAET